MRPFGTGGYPHSNAHVAPISQVSKGTEITSTIEPAIVGLEITFMILMYVVGALIFLSVVFGGLY